MRPMSRSTRETEIKLPFSAAEEAVERLLGIGARPVSLRVFEDNRVLDDERGSLALAGKLLRLRTAGGRSTLTVKSAAESGTRHKVRGEIEIDVEDPAVALRFLEILGYRVVWRYQKVRSTYALPEIEATVDETAIGCWVELEGDPAAIDRAAEALGFSPDRYVTATVRELAEAHAARSGREPGDLLLAAEAKPEVLP